jgi:hypothetical protein
VLDVDERHRHEERLAREVTDRLEAEQAARRERDFLAVVLGSMREGYIYTVDARPGASTAATRAPSPSSTT